MKAGSQSGKPSHCMPGQQQKPQPQPQHQHQHQHQRQQRCLLRNASGLEAQAEQAPIPAPSHAYNNTHICDSPRSSISESSPTRHSMAHHDTVYQLPGGMVGVQAESPTATSGVAKLSLEPKLTHRDQPLNTIPVTRPSTAAPPPPLPPSTVTMTAKRPAEADLSSTSPQNKRSTCGPHGIKTSRPRYSSIVAGQSSLPQTRLATTNRGPVSKSGKHPQARDSGYESKRQDSTDTTKSQIITGFKENVNLTTTSAHKDRRNKYPGLILEPDASPISADQLAMEVKSIYGGLVLVEAKCINIDAAQDLDPSSQLTAEQWQALIALHRTLLYEHHDFLMATQHPSATDSLRNLATKYTMPARMWKHGIHAFLEVLRHRRPQSQDYMLAFIYLAYQMMALLYETVDSFKDTWIECLGDLARYRMAIEEEREAHTTWGGVAARWYTLANDRHPAVGRLNHHLGILERPSLRKMYFYAKSLTCVLPFSNAKDSMTTLCNPILYDDELMRSSNQPTEAKIMYFQAMVFTGNGQVTTYSSRDEALALLRQESSSFILRVGVSLAITNIAALFEYGSPANIIRATFAHGISKSLSCTQPSLQVQPESYLDTSHLTTAVSTALEFCYSCFEIGLQQTENLTAIQNVSPFVHVMLSWLHGVISLRQWMKTPDQKPTASFRDMESVLIHGAHIPWGSLALFLNTLTVYYPLAERVLQCSHADVFLNPESQDYRPLPEDFMVRGLVWSYFYMTRDWFDGKLEDDSRHIETDATRKMRAERIQWLGLFLANHTTHLRFDNERQRFFAVAETGHSSIQPGSLTSASPMQCSLTASTLTSTSPLKSTCSNISAAAAAPRVNANGSLSPSSATLSAMSEGVDSSPESWTNVGFRSKRTGVPLSLGQSNLYHTGEPSTDMR